MPDVTPTGSTITIPTTNYVVPGLDTFNDFVTKVNASFNALGSSLTTLSATGASSDSVAKAGEKAQSDLKTAINDLSAKYLVAQTSFQPTVKAPEPSNNNWIILVVAFMITLFVMNKKNPL